MPESWTTAYRGLERLTRGVAEDDVQDAALAALLEPAGIDRKSSWLRATARNVYRARIRRAAIWDRVRTRIREPIGPEVDATAERAEISEALQRALTTLTPTIAEAVRLRFFEELTTPEIAQRQGCPHGTARWRVHQGLQQLRRALDDTHGGRQAWLPGVLALSELPTPSPHPLQTLKGPIMISIGTATLLSTLAYVGLHDVTDATTASVSPANITATAQPTIDAPVHPATSGPSVVSRPSLPSLPSLTPAPAPTSTTKSVVQTDDDAEYCAQEALRAHNATPDDPDADEHLLDAAECYTEAGVLGRAVIIYTVMARKFADSPNAQLARNRSRELTARLLNPEPDLALPLVESCMAPVDEAPVERRAHERVAAAECLMTGAWVSAAIRQRELAGASLSKNEQRDNAERLAKLKKLEHDYQAKVAE